MSFYYPQAVVQLRIYPEDYTLTSAVDPTKFTIINCQARDVTVNRNDYKTADTFSIEIDYKNFPFDPRIIRSCGVVIYMQDMGKLGDALQPGASTKINPDVSNAVFLGFADEENIEFNDTRRSVKLNGRDSTCLLIDQKYAQNKTIFPNQTLDVAIKTLISVIPALVDLKIVNNTDSPNRDFPILSSFYFGFGDKLAGGMNTGGGIRENYWEIIQEMVNQCGMICYMGMTVINAKLYPALIITTPKNQAQTLDQSTLGQTTKPIDDIKIIYGVNVKNLQLKRKLGRLKNINLQVRARVGKQVLIAKIPEEATVAWGTAFGFTPTAPGVNPNGAPTNFPAVTVPVIKPDGSLDTTQNHVAPYITFPYPGNKISTHEQLVQIGQTAYEQYSLQQLEGSFETFEMLGRGTTSDPGVNNKASFTTYDLTQIKKGQTICLEIDPDDMDGISRFNTVQQKTDYLIQKNYDPKVASLLAQTINKMSPRFQIKDYSMNINQDSGFKLSVRFQNILNLTQKGISK
jgi:hypothetical protein